MQISPVGHNLVRFHFAGKCSTAPSATKKRKRTEIPKWLIRGWCERRRVAIVGKLKSGEVTPLDLLDVLEKRIAEVDGKVNALPTLCFDRARTHATALMKKPAAERGLLAGIPIPIKDLTASRAC